jgi:hypothetical protein
MTKVINTQIHKNKNKILQERIEKLNIKDNLLYKIAKLLRKRKTPVGNIVTNTLASKKFRSLKKLQIILVVIIIWELLY